MLADVQDGVSGHDAATRKEFEERCPLEMRILSILSAFRI